MWYDYDPDTLRLGPFRWFGSIPSLGLPDPGDKVAKHPKGDATGSKNAKPGHRVLRKSRFITVQGIADLRRFLFGCDDSNEKQLLHHAMSEPPDSTAPAWVHEVYAGQPDAVPDDLRWKNSIELAHLIAGYELAGSLGICDPFEFQEVQFARATETGRWLGGPAVLWTTLFLKHRRWRFANPTIPDPETELLLDRLCRQLTASLRSAFRSAP